MELLREAKKPISIAPQCELRTTGRVMVEVAVFINGVLQPVPPVWLPVEANQQKKDEH